MAVDVFVTITGKTQGPIKGESRDQAFPGAMEIQSFALPTTCAIIL